MQALGRRAAASDDAERIDRIRVLEELRGALAAAQADESDEFATSQKLSAAHPRHPRAA